MRRPRGRRDHVGVVVRRSSRTSHRVLALVAVAGVAGAGLGLSGAAAGATSVNPRSVTPPGTTYAVVKTIAVGNGPTYVAVNNEDDSVYVSLSFPFTAAIVDGRTGLVSGSLTPTLSGAPSGIAVDQNDDTVYIAAPGPAQLAIVRGATATQVGSPIGVGAGPEGVAVNNADDTVYVVNNSSSNASVINGRTGVRTDDTITGLASPFGVAVDQGDDTIYVSNSGVARLVGVSANATSPYFTTAVGDWTRGVAVNSADDRVYVVTELSSTVKVLNGRTGALDDTIGVGAGAKQVAVDQQDDTVYVTNGTFNNVSVIDGALGERTDDTITVGTTPRGIAVDESGPNRGLVYIANYGSHSLSVIGRVSPTMTTTTAMAGSTAVLSLDAPQVSYDVDDSTVASVAFDGVTATGLTAGAGDTWSVTVPPGAEGSTVLVTVTFKGGLTATAGSFTYGVTPVPIPPTPSGPPTSVVAVAGESSASVSWSAPTSSGSFPVSHYVATSTPGAHTCLVAAPGLTCDVRGLTNGTAYTFTVQALTGAGWSASSEPSNVVVPRPSAGPLIVITGSRDGRRIEVSGTTTGFGMGAILNPWVLLSGQSAYTQGAAQVLVSMDGTFTWGRTTGKRAFVYMQTPDGSVKSNTVTIAAR